MFGPPKVEDWFIIDGFGPSFPSYEETACQTAGPKRGTPGAAAERVVISLTLTNDMGLCFVSNMSLDIPCWCIRPADVRPHCTLADVSCYGCANSYGAGGERKGQDLERWYTGITDTLSGWLTPYIFSKHAVMWL